MSLREILDQMHQFLDHNMDKNDKTLEKAPNLFKCSSTKKNGNKGIEFMLGKSAYFGCNNVLDR